MQIVFCYLFDLEEEVSPSTVQKKQLLLQIKRHGLVARFDKKIPRVVHGCVLIHPVAEIPEKLLEEKKILKTQKKLYYGRLKRRKNRDKGTKDFRKTKNTCQNVK